MRAKIKQTNDYFKEMWQKYNVWIILLMIGFLFDTMTTIHFMTRETIFFEAHPLVRYSALLMGPIVGTILSAFCFKFVVSIFLALYLKRMQLWILVIPTITSTLAGFYNLFISP